MNGESEPQLRAVWCSTIHYSLFIIVNYSLRKVPLRSRLGRGNYIVLSASTNSSIYRGSSSTTGNLFCLFFVYCHFYRVFVALLDVNTVFEIFLYLQKVYYILEESILHFLIRGPHLYSMLSHVLNVSLLFLAYSYFRFLFFFLVGDTLFFLIDSYFSISFISIVLS